MLTSSAGNIETTMAVINGLPIPILSKSEYRTNAYVGIANAHNARIYILKKGMFFIKPSKPNAAITGNKSGVFLCYVRATASCTKMA